MQLYYVNLQQTICTCSIQNLLCLILRVMTFIFLLLPLLGWGVDPTSWRFVDVGQKQKMLVFQPSLFNRRFLCYFLGRIYAEKNAWPGDLHWSSCPLPCNSATSPERVVWMSGRFADVKCNVKLALEKANSGELQVNFLGIDDKFEEPYSLSVFSHSIHIYTWNPWLPSI